MIAGSSLKCTGNKLCSRAALLKFWFQTVSGRENSASFYRQGRQLLLPFLTIVTRWSRCENLTGEFTWQIYASSGNLLTVGDVDRVLCDLMTFYLSFSTGCTKRNLTQLLSRFFCYSRLVCLLGFWLEKCAAFQSRQKSDFGRHRFQKWAPTSPCSMRKELKSLKRFWPYLLAFWNCIW